jgi:hypothetical protein
MDAQDGRVVIRARADKKIPHPFRRRELGENGTQVILTQLAGSTAGGGE